VGKVKQLKNLITRTNIEKFKIDKDIFEKYQLGKDILAKYGLVEFLSVEEQATLNKIRGEKHDNQEN